MTSYYSNVNHGGAAAVEPEREGNGVRGFLQYPFRSARSYLRTVCLPPKLCGERSITSNIDCNHICAAIYYNELPT